MQMVHDIAALRTALGAARSAGQRVVLVPTMGNLHEGHCSLVRAARAHGEFVVATVFVNPLQFGANEDFGRYPRTLEADAAALAKEGCDLLFAPSVQTMYPRGLPITTSLVAQGVARSLEGQFRPGHFDGVATVVNLLFNLVQPDVACFGQKDYQQLAVIRQMVRDLHLPVRIVGLPTQRAADGLALSSRNQYLQPDERQKASVIFAVLKTIEHELLQGSRNFAGLAEAGADALTAHGFKPQYVSIQDLSLEEPSATGPWVVLVAAYLGTTRLIDNLVVGEGAPAL